MPKAKDKGKKRKSDDATKNTFGINLDKTINSCTRNEKIEKKKNCSFFFPMEPIAKSQVLRSKLETSTPRIRVNEKNTQPRVCGNGKPMPSLAELEKLYEDSDEEDTLPVKQSPIHEPNTSDRNDIVITPTTIQDIATKLDICVTKLTSSAVTSSLPVIQRPKKDKNKKPYIVGCKERPQVSGHFNAKVGRGDLKFGREQTLNTLDDDYDDEGPSKRRKKSHIQTPSHSLFNAKEKDIVELLKENDVMETRSNISVDSNTTLPYEISISPIHNQPSSFSPIPSTSMDKETFLKNDKRFSESLGSFRQPVEMEPFEIPCETILVDDGSDSEVSRINIELKTSRSNSPPDDFYSTFDINKTFIYSADICEVIDVDDVIAENRAILDKHRINNYGSFTSIAPNQLYNVEILNDDFEHSIEFTTSNNSSINKVVQDFFNKQTSNSSAGSDISSTNNYSKLSQKALYKKMMDSMVEHTDKVLSTQPTETTMTKAQSEPQVTETINLTSEENSKVIPILDDSIITLSSPLPRPICNSLQTIGDDVIFVPPSSKIVGRPAKPKLRNLKNKTMNAPPVPVAKSPPNASCSNNNSIAAPVASNRIIGDCPICMDNLSTTNVASTTCGHIFCMKCITKALKTQNGKRCPTCRNVLKGNGFHQLFL